MLQGALGKRPRALRRSFAFEEFAEPAQAVVGRCACGEAEPRGAVLQAEGALFEQHGCERLPVGRRDGDRRLRKADFHAERAVRSDGGHGERVPTVARGEQP